MMKSSVAGLFAAVFVAAIAVPTLAEEGGQDVKNCYSVHGEARYGAFAYKHVVIVTNRCEFPLQCEVWTDVDPTPRHSVSVDPKGTAEVLTRNNSPARSFKAFGECKK